MTEQEVKIRLEQLEYAIKDNDSRLKVLAMDGSPAETTYAKVLASEETYRQQIAQLLKVQRVLLNKEPKDEPA